MTKRYSPIQILGSSVLALGLLLPAACGGGEGGDEPMPPMCNPVEANGTTAIVTPAQMFTGYNGQELYQSVIVTNFGELSFNSSDAQVVSAETHGCITQGAFGISGLVTAEGPGQATISVVSGSFSRDIPVTVTEYTATDHALGEERYNNPANPGADRMGCAECHSEAGGAPHDPLALGGLSDLDLIAATTQGKYLDKCVLPTGVNCNCTPAGTDPDTACAACGSADCRFSEGITLDLDRTNAGADPHLMNLTIEEEVGVMAYMRAIPPNGI